MRETWVSSLGQEDPLEKEMAIHSSTLAWKIPWMESLVGYSPQGCKESDTTEQLHYSSVYVKMKFLIKMSQAMVPIDLFLEKRRGTEDAKK